MKIAVIDDYQNAFRNLECYARLKDHEVVVFHDTEKDASKLAARLQDAEAVILTQQRSPVPRALVERLPKLKLLSQTGRNANHIDVAACTEKGVVVSAGGGGIPTPAAELTWALILASLRRIPQEVQRMKEGQWQGSVGVGVSGKTLGVYAFGRIGSMVAKVGKAFDMRVICWASREAFFENADVVCLHLPLNKETRGIVTAQDLARMKPTALIVNTSRAQIIAEGVLVAALKQGRPGFAAVDVYEDEPVLGGNHPLLKLDNATCTPHLGYVEQDTYEAYFGTAIDQILAFAAGKPINVLNPEVLEKK